MATESSALAIAIPIDLALSEAFQEAVASVLLRAGEGTHTFRAYRRALSDFLTWYSATQRAQDGRLFPLSGALVLRYRNHLEYERGIAASSINQRLAPIKRLGRELSRLEVITEAAAANIALVEGARQQGQRLGHWLTLEQAQALLDAPDVSTLKGLRDRAILGVFLGSGVRRDELEHLTVEHMQLREGRWMLVDVHGKHHRVRSIPIPAWLFVALDAWLRVAGIASGPLFRAIDKGGHVHYQVALSDQALRNIAKRYLIQHGRPNVAPHDLRRTYAKLAHKGGASIEQIQLSLGHASIETTRRYLGVDQDLTDAPGDRLGLRLS